MRDTPERENYRFSSSDFNFHLRWPAMGIFGGIRFALLI